MDYPGGPHLITGVFKRIFSGLGQNLYSGKSDERDGL